MAKLPFGGDIRPEENIDPYSDPKPHLRKIARCAMDGVPMPPALASWIWSVHQNLALIHRGPSGRPPCDSPEVRHQAVCEIEQSCASGMKEKQAIKSVHEKLRLNAKPDTVYDWLAKHRAARREEHEEYVEGSRCIAIERFKELLQQGVANENALNQVSSILDWPVRPDREQLERWQGEAEYELAKARSND
jgi:uncharacterized protein YoaH (UPF0181 family)